jgi:hypothetical protein
MKSWKTTAAGLFFVAVGVMHAIWPQKVSADWPAVALLILGVGLLFARRISPMLPYIKRLKLGQAEVEMREKLEDLRINVEKLEGKLPAKLVPKAGTKEAMANAEKEEDLQTRILELAVTDRESALIRLSIEIEKQLALLSQRVGSKETNATWRRTVDVLLQAGVIEPTLAKAVIEFRDVRNRVIHSGLRSPVRREVLTRAIDNGLIILQYLKGTTAA